MDVFIFRRNPDFSFIRVNPGEWVVLKPNLVKECKETDPKEWESVITSPIVIEAVCRDVAAKLQGRGKITICDAPQTDSSFKAIVARLGLVSIAERCKRDFGVEVEILDLRGEEWVNDGGVIRERNRLAGDPNGSISFNLGENSLFYQFAGEGHYYGADYDTRVVNRHHRGRTQEYLICGTPVKADVFINLPKMKTHKKAGVTLNLKNLVGINADKNWLPHHTEPTAPNGGDQFPVVKGKNRMEHTAVKLVRRLALRFPSWGVTLAKQLRRVGSAFFGDGTKTLRSGNWYGNDTCWRMVLDLNRCLLYGNPNGTLSRSSPKRYYSVIDGLIGMDGAGPMHGDPVQSNVLVCGTDPVAVDLVAARVMGFDWRKIPTIAGAIGLSAMPVTDVNPGDINVISPEEPAWNGTFSKIEAKEFLRFRPHQGWVGHIEYP